MRQVVRGQQSTINTPAQFLLLFLSCCRYHCFSMCILLLLPPSFHTGLCRCRRAPWLCLMPRTSCASSMLQVFWVVTGWLLGVAFGFRVCEQLTLYLLRLFCLALYPVCLFQKKHELVAYHLPLIVNAACRHISGRGGDAAGSWCAELGAAGRSRHDGVLQGALPHDAADCWQVRRG